MRESEKKDKILAYLNIEENRNGFFQLNDLNRLVFKEGSLSDTEMRYLVECMDNDGYLIYNDPVVKYKYTITPFLESGGYKGKEERIKSKAEEKSKREKVSDQKTQYDFKLAKWQVIIFWPIFIITLIGSILGSISFFMQVGK